MKGFTRAQIVIFGTIGLIVLFFILVIAGVIPGLRLFGVNKVELRFWGVFDDPEVYAQLISEYKKTHPNVSVSYEQKSEDAYEAELIDALAAGRGPDIFMIANTWLLKHQDKLAPLPPDLLNLRTFQETFVDVVNFDLVRSGFVYAMPLSVETMALLWNKELFAAAGIALPPRTWEEFAELVPRLKKIDALGRIQQAAAAMGENSQNINRAQDLVSLLMIQAGSKMSDTLDGRADLAFSNNRAASQALRFYTQFADSENPLYTWDREFHYSLDAFPEGNLAMLFTYHFRVPTIRAKNQVLKFGVAPMPQFENAAHPITYANYWAPAVSAQSRRQREAWQFLVFMASKDQARKYLQATQKPPARRDLVPEFQRDPELGVFAEQSLRAVSWIQPDPVAVERIFDEMIENVNLNRATPQEAVEKAENAINLLIR